VPFMISALLHVRCWGRRTIVVRYDALGRRANCLDRFKLKIDTFETFGFEKWTLSTESGVSILVGCRVALEPERLADISVQFGTANGATIPALGVGPLAISSPAISG
jgi:hypothetical protein